MRNVPTRLRRLVIQRARNRCEYCGLSQAGQAATFHIDHIVPLSEAGETALDNLALACVTCSLSKGARQTGIDPQTGTISSIYNPRSQVWSEHFRWENTKLVGLTPIGRATTEALRLNRPVLLAIRGEETHFGRHPPPSDT